MAGDAEDLRLRVTRRAEHDVDRLMEWVLNIAEARYRAYLAGEPDPYGLPLPESLGEQEDGKARSPEPDRRTS